MESYSICHFATGLFHLACPQCSSTLYHVRGFPSFLRQNNIPLYVYTSFCLTSHPLVTFRLLPSLCHCELCCTEYRWANISLGSCFLMFGYIPRSEIAGFYDSYIFNILRNLYAILYSGCTILQSH